MTTRRLLAAFAITGLALSSASLGCREEGPAERFGRALDDSLESAEEAAEEAAERIRKSVDEAKR